MPRDDRNLRILKKHRVKTAGTRRIGVPVAADSPSGEPQARILEQSGRATAVEVACTCGRKIYLQLDYAAAQDDPAAEPPTAPPAPDQPAQP